MDMFDFEELVAEMLGISDDQREDDDCLEDAFYEKFEISMEEGFALAQALLPHTVAVEAGLSGKAYHAFVSRKEPVMLMKMEAVRDGVERDADAGVAL